MRSRPSPTPRPTRFVIRPSLVSRFYGGWAFFIGLAWIAIGVLASEPAGRGLPMVVAGILAAVFGVRVIRARVVALSDEIRIYNRFRNYRIARSDASAVELRNARRTLWQSLRLPRPERTVGVLFLRSGDAIAMYATERNDYGRSEGYFGPPSNAQQVQALRDYLGLPSAQATGGGPPTP